MNSNKHPTLYSILGTLLIITLSPIHCTGIDSNNFEQGIESTNHWLLHPTHRIYSLENANVREEVYKLETRDNHYWTTGTRGDISFEVSYENHPFDSKRKRHLQENGDVVVENFMKPLRIHWDAYSLDNQRNTNNGAQIDFVKNIIMPRMTQFWSEALQVVPVSGNLKLQGTELMFGYYCGDSEFAQVPDEHLSKGVPDTDIILYISGTPSTRFCGPTTLAVAVACNWDQFDRPTAGAINFCLNQVKVDANGSANQSVIDDNVDVAINAAGRILGMSSNSFRFFWNTETGTPRTPRPFKPQSVTCVDGTTKWAYIPAENTLKFKTNEWGDRFASIVTQKVRVVVQNQFDCDQIEGAQLENQSTGSSCTGDHWDERLFYPETMSGVISPSTNVLSPVTLALMEDSGWYRANYSQSTVSPWGHGAGCDFVQKPCLELGADGVTTVPEYGRGFFCTEASQRGCSPTHSYKMACFLRDYGAMNTTVNLPPSRFQYFSNPSLGGLKTADYCPVFGDSYKSNVHSLDCRDPANGDEVDWLGLDETFGPDSTCFESTIGEGICYSSKCVKDDFKLHIQIQGTWFVCEEDFQEIEIPTSVSNVAVGRKIICPRLQSVCPDMYCRANCAGRGRCNFQAVVNGKIRPQCECFDKNDTSKWCTTSIKESSGVDEPSYMPTDKPSYESQQKGEISSLVTSQATSQFKSHVRTVIFVSLSTLYGLL